MRFAIFDVDLTLTSKDTFIEFYKFLCKQDKRFLIYFNKVVHAGLMYCLKFYDEKKSKEQYLSFLNGVEEIGQSCFLYCKSLSEQIVLFKCAASHRPINIF